MTAAEEVIIRYLEQDAVTRFEIHDTLKPYCKNCGEMPARHAAGHCLFDNRTTYEPLATEEAAELLVDVTLDRYAAGEL